MHGAVHTYTFTVLSYTQPEVDSITATHKQQPPPKEKTAPRTASPTNRQTDKLKH